MEMRKSSPDVYCVWQNDETRWNDVAQYFKNMYHDFIFIANNLTDLGNPANAQCSVE